MYHPEPIFVSSAEYKSGKDKRHLETQLQAGELYSIMYALSENDKGKEAAILPAKLLGVPAVQESGIYKVELELLDADLNPTFRKTGEFHDGYWIDVAQHVSVITVSEDHDAVPTEEAYITDYNDGMGDFSVLLASDAREFSLAGSTPK